MTQPNKRREKHPGNPNRARNMRHPPIAPDVLRWAVERSGRAEALARKFPQLEEWLAGKRLPTFRQLESLAKATLTPLGYLFLPQPPQETLPIPHFRTLHDQQPQRPSVALLETVSQMQRRQQWLRDYLIEQGHQPLAFVGAARPDAAVEDVAGRMREVLRLPPQWAREYKTWSDALKGLMRRMEEVGILVVASGIVGNNTRWKLDVEEFRGLVLVDEYAPLVFVNAADSKAAQMFTLAHELAHVWYGKSVAFDLGRLEPAEDAFERRCNQVAAEFLLPARDLRGGWPAVSGSHERFRQVAHHFKVSELVVARRALDLELIEREEFFEFYEGFLRRQQAAKRRRRGGNYYANQTLRVGRRFALAVAQAVAEGELLYREAYQLTGLYGDAFDKFLASLSRSEAA